MVAPYAWYALVFGVGVALLFPVGYFIWLFVMYRRPPVRGRAVVTEFSPPEGVAPAEAAYLLDGTLKPRAVAATLIDLSLRGVIAIEEEAGRISGFVRSGLAPHDRHEAVILDMLFADGTSVTFEEAERRMADSGKEITASIIGSLRGKGLILEGVDPGKIIIAASAAIAAVVFHVRLVAVVGFAPAFVSFLVYIVLLEMSYIATTWRPQLTRKGRDVMWRLIGFRRYLTTAESGRIRWEETKDRTHPMTPYAIVFGITMTWATRLQKLTDSLIENVKVY